MLQRQDGFNETRDTGCDAIPDDFGGVVRSSGRCTRCRTGCVLAQLCTSCRGVRDPGQITGDESVTEGSVRASGEHAARTDCEQPDRDQGNRIREESSH